MSLKYSTTTADYLVWSDAMNLIRKLSKDKNYKMSLLIALGCFTGLRISDILALTWEQILNTDEFTITEKKTPVELSVAGAYTGVSRTHPTVERYLIHLGKSERHSLHDPANQRNPERDKEEISLESEELQLSLTPQDLWQTGLQHEQRKL